MCSSIWEERQLKEKLLSTIFSSAHHERKCCRYSNFSICFKYASSVLEDNSLTLCLTKSATAFSNILLSFSFSFLLLLGFEDACKLDSKMALKYQAALLKGSEETVSSKEASKCSEEKEEAEDFICSKIWWIEICTSANCFIHWSLSFLLILKEFPFLKSSAVFFL